MSGLKKDPPRRHGASVCLSDRRTRCREDTEGLRATPRGSAKGGFRLRRKSSRGAPAAPLGGRDRDTPGYKPMPEPTPPALIPAIPVDPRLKLLALAFALCPIREIPKSVAKKDLCPLPFRTPNPPNQQNGFSPVVCCRCRLPSAPPRRRPLQEAHLPLLVQDSADGFHGAIAGVPGRYLGFGGATRARGPGRIHERIEIQPHHRVRRAG